MSDKFPFFAAESGTWRTTSPNPHVDLSGTALTLGTYPVQTFAAAAADTTLAFDSGQTCTVTIWKDATNFKRYEGAIWTDAATDTLDLSAATLAGTAGSIANGDSVSVVASIPAITPSAIGALPVDSNGVISVTNVLGDFTATATSGQTITLTVGSKRYQKLTGTEGATVVLPVVSTLVLGQTFVIDNDSTQAITVNSSGGNLVVSVAPDSWAEIQCGAITGTTAASWDLHYPATRSHTQAETTITFTDVTTGNASTSAHGFSPKATAPAAGLLSVLGIANSETVRSDKALFDTTAPSDSAATALAGTELVAARRDHVHKSSIVLDFSNAVTLYRNVADVFRLTAVRTGFPRTATVSSVSGAVVTLTAAVARQFCELNSIGSYGGLSINKIEITNTTRSTKAWAISAEATDTLTFTSASDVSGWQNGDTIQLDQTKTIAGGWVKCSLGPIMYAIFGSSTFQCRGVFVNLNVSGDAAATAPATLRISPTGALGTAVDCMANPDGLGGSNMQVIATTENNADGERVFYAQEKVTGSNLATVIARITGIII